MEMKFKKSVLGLSLADNQYLFIIGVIALGSALSGLVLADGDTDNYNDLSVVQAQGEAAVEQVAGQSIPEDFDSDYFSRAAVRYGDHAQAPDPIYPTAVHARSIRISEVRLPTTGPLASRVISSAGALPDYGPLRSISLGTTGAMLGQPPSEGTLGEHPFAQVRYPGFYSSAETAPDSDNGPAGVTRVTIRNFASATHTAPIQKYEDWMINNP